MLEAASLKSLMDRGGFLNNWSWALNRTWWTREHDIGLGLLCRHQVPVEKSANLMARAPSSLAWRAREFNLVLPKDWRDAISRKKLASGPRIQLQYPYIADVRGEHADLLAVNALVPRNMLDHMRADVCQEIMLALWQKETSIEELKKAPALIRKYCGRVRTMNYEGGGYCLSLDMPMRDGRKWYDVLPDTGIEPEDT